MNHQIKLLLAYGVLLWAVTAYPAYWLWGESALILGSVAALIVILPAAGSLYWGGKAFGQAPDQQLLIFVGCMGLRMFVTLGLGFAIHALAPDFQGTDFWFWLLGWYLVVLALEMSLLLSALQAQAAATKR